MSRPSWPPDSWNPRPSRRRSSWCRTQRCCCPCRRPRYRSWSRSRSGRSLFVGGGVVVSLAGVSIVAGASVAGGSLGAGSAGAGSLAAGGGSAAEECRPAHQRPGGLGGVDSATESGVDGAGSSAYARDRRGRPLKRDTPLTRRTAGSGDDCERAAPIAPEVRSLNIFEMRMSRRGRGQGLSPSLDRITQSWRCCPCWTTSRSRHRCSSGDPRGAGVRRGRVAAGHVRCRGTGVRGRTRVTGAAAAVRRRVAGRVVAAFAVCIPPASGRNRLSRKR